MPIWYNISGCKKKKGAESSEIVFLVPQTCGFGLISALFWHFSIESAHCRKKTPRGDLSALHEKKPRPRNINALSWSFQPVAEKSRPLQRKVARCRRAGCAWCTLCPSIFLRQILTYGAECALFPFCAYGFIIWFTVFFFLWFICFFRTFLNSVSHDCLHCTGSKNNIQGILE